MEVEDMTRSEYLRKANEAFDSGKVSEEVYDGIVMNADIFCEDDDEGSDYGLPDTYAEIEYDDFDDAEAIDGARWDDMNYLHYMER